MQTVADMRGVGVKNREKIADVHCGRPLRGFFCSWSLWTFWHFLAWVLLVLSLDLDFSFSIWYVPEERNFSSLSFLIAQEVCGFCSFNYDFLSFLWILGDPHWWCLVISGCAWCWTCADYLSGTELESLFHQFAVKRLVFWFFLIKQFFFSIGRWKQILTCTFYSLFTLEGEQK